MKASRVAAVGLVVAAVAWIASGHLFPHETAQSKAADGRARRREAVSRGGDGRARQPRSRKLMLSGRTEADRKMMVAARGGGAITQLEVRRGQFVKKDEIIAILSDEAREAQVLQAPRWSISGGRARAT